MVAPTANPDAAKANISSPPELDRYAMINAKAAYDHSGIPRRFYGARFDNSEHIPPGCRAAHHLATRKIREFIERREGGLMLLTGPRGGGKTRLACAAILAGAMAGRTVRYATLAEIVTAYRSTFASGAAFTEAALERLLIGVHLLVIDEAHELAGTDFEQRTIVRLLVARHAQDRQTIIAANLQPKAMLARLGVSVEDRMSEGGQIVEMNWPSLRGVVTDTPAAAERYSPTPLNPRFSPVRYFNPRTDN